MNCKLVRQTTWNFYQEPRDYDWLCAESDWQSWHPTLRTSNSLPCQCEPKGAWPPWLRLLRPSISWHPRLGLPRWILQKLQQAQAAQPSAYREVCRNVYRLRRSGCQNVILKQFRRNLLLRKFRHWIDFHNFSYNVYITTTYPGLSSW